MISFLNAASQSFLYSLEQTQNRASQAQLQVSSGNHMNQVADDPTQVPNLFALQSAMSRNDQIAQNMTQVKAEVDTGESALESAVTQVERAQTLGAQGASSLTDAGTRQTLAGELSDILQTLVSISNTASGGRYIFSGDSDQTAPYSIDLTLAAPVSGYQGSASTRQIQHPDGSLFPVAQTAQQIFDSPNAQDNVFASITALRAALLNNDTAGINAALPIVQSAGTYLNSELAFYGHAQNRVADAVNYGANLKVQLQTQLSGIQGADMTQSILEMTQASTQEQAALESWSKLPRTSLFDFLG